MLRVLTPVLPMDAPHLFPVTDAACATSPAVDVVSEIVGGVPILTAARVSAGLCFLCIVIILAHLPWLLRRLALSSGAFDCVTSVRMRVKPTGDITVVLSDCEASTAFAHLLNSYALGMLLPCQIKRLHLLDASLTLRPWALVRCLLLPAAPISDGQQPAASNAGAHGTEHRRRRCALELHIRRARMEHAMIKPTVWGSAQSRTTVMAEMAREKACDLRKRAAMCHALATDAAAASTPTNPNGASAARGSRSGSTEHGDRGGSHGAEPRGVKPLAWLRSLGRRWLGWQSSCRGALAHRRAWVRAALANTLHDRLVGAFGVSIDELGGEVVGVGAAIVVQVRRGPVAALAFVTRMPVEAPCLFTQPVEGAGEGRLVVVANATPQTRRARPPNSQGPSTN